MVPMATTPEGNSDIEAWAKGAAREFTFDTPSLNRATILFLKQLSK